MKKVLFLGMLAGLGLVAGCLSSPPPSPTCWNLVWVGQRSPTVASAQPARLLGVGVSAPYAGSQIVVERPDGSLAFDHYHVFAAAPSALLREAACAALGDLKGHSTVLVNRALMPTEISYDLQVTRLALDCRQAGPGQAVCALTLLAQKGRESPEVVHAQASVPVQEGRLGVAFSTAFSSALEQAVERLSAQ